MIILSIQGLETDNFLLFLYQIFPITFICIRFLNVSHFNFTTTTIYFDFFDKEVFGVKETITTLKLYLNSLNLRCSTEN